MAASKAPEIISLLMLFSAPLLARTPVSDSTHLFMAGDILDTPCTIAPESREQTINMGSVTVAQIVRQGSGRKVPFSIHLIDCTLTRTNPRLPDWQSFAVTFNGINDADNFAVNGGAKGVALKIADTRDNIAHPGVALPLTALHPGEQVLHYTLQLVGDNHAIQEGSYSSVVHFQLNYF